MVDRIKALCKAQDTSVTKLEAALGFGNGTIGKWRNAKSVPSVDKLQKVAEALGVTIGYLLEGENENKPTENGELTQTQREAWELIMKIPEDKLKVLIASLKATMGE